jgi:hypothetical protein
MNTASITEPLDARQEKGRVRARLWAVKRGRKASQIAWRASQLDFMTDEAKTMFFAAFIADAARSINGGFDAITGKPVDVETARYGFCDSVAVAARELLEQTQEAEKGDLEEEEENHG